MRILIVDDDKISRQILLNSLIKYGECMEARNGNETIVKFQEAYDSNRPFNLITLDLMMPDKTGPAVYSEIRKIEEKLNIAESDQVDFLIVTTQNYLGKVMKTKLRGHVDYITKPVNHATLIKKLADLGYYEHSNIEEIVNDELKDIFLEELRNRIIKLKRYLENQNLDQIERIGHKLHGTGSAYGFPEVTVAGAKLESASKNGDWTEINSEVNTLTNLYQKNR